MKTGAQQITEKGGAHNSDHSNLNISEMNSAQKDDTELREQEGSQQLYEVTLEN